MDLVNPFMHSCLCVFIHKEEISTEGQTEPRSHTTRGGNVDIDFSGSGFLGITFRWRC